MMSGINTNWRNHLRGMAMTNLSVWMGEEPNLMFKKEYVARYDALKAENSDSRDNALQSGDNRGNALQSDGADSRNNKPEKKHKITRFLRALMIQNLAFWIDEEENPVMQNWFSQYYPVLEIRRHEIL